MNIGWYLFFLSKKGRFDDCGEEMLSELKIKPEISL
jgi:hypothetical protein